MKIELNKAWLVKNSRTIEEGFGFETDTIDGGITTRNNEKFFTKDGLNFVRSNWCDKVFFDLSYAKIYLKDEKKKRKESAHKQIAYYQKIIEELSN